MVIIKKPGMANDCEEETEQIISMSIEKIKVKHLYSLVIPDYMQKLKVDLSALSPAGFDYIHWSNFRSGVL